MARVFGCKLDRNRRPRWPDRCVVCGQARPDGQAEVVGRNHAPAKRRLLLGNWSAVEAPCCRQCAPRLRTNPGMTMFRILGTGLFTFVIGAYLASRQGWSTGRQGAAGFAAMIASMVGLLVWQYRHPPAATFDARRTETTYWFASRDYAEEFARRNAK